MSVARRRRRHMAWCRYLARAEFPLRAWLHRAPGCLEPRPPGVVRAWDALADKTARFPWKP